MAMRADIATLAAARIELRRLRLKQVERHPNVALHLQHRMGAHDAAGNPHAAELTNLNRDAVHKRKAQNIVQTSPGRNLPRLKICRSLARKSSRTSLALQPGTQRRLVFAVRLDVHGAAIGR